MSTDFRKQIKDLQERKGMTTHATAKLVGLKSYSTLYNFLNGDTEMTTAILTKVLDALNALPDKDEKEVSSRR